MKCLLCGKEITLVPSATERAAKYGGTAEFYTKLFPYHSSCTLAERKRSTSELIRKINESKLL